MGDAADDVLSAAWQWDEDVQAALRGMREKCQRPCDRPRAFWNDAGLLECRDCGQMADV